VRGRGRERKNLGFRGRECRAEGGKKEGKKGKKNLRFEFI